MKLQRGKAIAGNGRINRGTIFIFVQELDYTPRGRLALRAAWIRSRTKQSRKGRSSGMERSNKRKRPGSGVDRVFEAVQKEDNRSGRLRCCLLGYALCLRAFLSLNNFEFNVIALLEAFVSLRLDGTVVDEHIRAVIPADKAEALCVIEPFHFTFNSRHVPYSGLSLGTQRTVGPRTSFFSWVCHSFWEGT
jgi:hypothetical protein